MAPSGLLCDESGLLWSCGSSLCSAAGFQVFTKIRSQLLTMRPELLVHLTLQHLEPQPDIIWGWPELNRFLFLSSLLRTSTGPQKNKLLCWWHKHLYLRLSQNLHRKKYLWYFVLSLGTILFISGLCSDVSSFLAVEKQLTEEYLIELCVFCQDVEKDRQLRTEVSTEEIQQKIEQYNSHTRDLLKMTLVSGKDGKRVLFYLHASIKDTVS